MTDFASMLLPDRGQPARTIHVVHPDAYDAWLGTQPQRVRTTVAAHRLTEDANFYFKPVALADYKASLGALGEPTGFAQTGRARLRGGFVNRTYRITYPDRTLSLSTYAEPGANGRYEQFLVAPSQ